MAGPEGIVGEPDTKLQAQVNLLVNAFREKANIRVEAIYTPAGRLDYLYEWGSILVHDAYVDRVRSILPRGQGDPEGLMNGVTLLRIPEVELTIPALERIDATFGVGVATPNHILSITRIIGFPGGVCPPIEPEQVPAGAQPDPVPRAGNDGAGVSIYVPDTGFLDGAAAAHSWLRGVTGVTDPVTVDEAGRQWIPPYAGHGTFVAGTARCVAPGSEIFVANAFDTAGAVLESDAIMRLDEALGTGPDIISLSAGGNSRFDLPYLGFEVFFRERLSHYKGVAFVAAAGNNAERRPFWPAAFPETISVGALAANWRRRADFTDFGGWVDVYAPGDLLVNAFASGQYRYTEPPNKGMVGTFSGMARWSGTSLSVPLVSGMIAARMSRTGENARRAADALLAEAREHALPGVGPVLTP